MRNKLIFVVFLFLLLACKSRNHDSVEQFCLVDYDSLLHVLDTSSIEIDSFAQDSTEVRDTSVNNGVGSVFHFDAKGKLGLYAFMFNWPYTNFMIFYDSTGRKQRMQQNEVVQWRYKKPKGDSNLKLTVLLCAVDRNYGNLRLYTSEYCDTSIRLFESSYSKIICFKSNLPINQKLESIKVYLKGETMEKCNKERFFFTDSATIELK